jgi:hypothetical protein
VGQKRTYLKAVAIRVCLSSTGNGLTKTPSVFLIIGAEILGRWQKGALGGGLPQSNLWIGTNGKKVVAQFVKLKLR